MRHSFIQFSSVTGGMLVSFIVSHIDFRQFPIFLLSESSTVFSSSKRLESTNSFYMKFIFICSVFKNAIILFVCLSTILHQYCFYFLLGQK